jgi:hypothetical protein
MHPNPSADGGDPNDNLELVRYGRGYAWLRPEPIRPPGRPQYVLTGARPTSNRRTQARTLLGVRATAEFA